MNQSIFIFKSLVEVCREVVIHLLGGICMYLLLMNRGAVLLESEWLFIQFIISSIKVVSFTLKEYFYRDLNYALNSRDP